jgi:hypothetical protein
MSAKKTTMRSSENASDRIELKKLKVRGKT